MEFLRNFREFDAFEKFCRENREHCPAKENEKANDRIPVCHWCRVSFSHAITICKYEVIKRLQD
jgi:hypothetical protein